MTLEEQIAFLKKGTVDCVPEDELKRKLERAAETVKPLRVKAGFDPTAPDIHLGHTVLVRKMRHFQQLGHQVIFLIGSFTGMIGDPSGRSATRPPLTFEQILENAETYKQQIFKLLDPDRTEIRFNSEWFSEFRGEDFIRLAAKATVAQLLERDDFKKRFESKVPISLHELLYPMAQGYDSVALEADVELGGTDQKFNLLMARQVQQGYGIKEPQLIMTTPLLEGLDGVQKMSKSLDNYIGITEPPSEMLSKILRISDDLMWRYYELLTDLSPREIDEMKSSCAAGERNPLDLKKDLARQIITDFHSEIEAEGAIKKRDEMVKEHDPVKQAQLIYERDRRGEAKNELTKVSRPASGRIKLVKLMAELGLTSSVADAQRRVKNDGITLVYYPKVVGPSAYGDMESLQKSGLKKDVTYEIDTKPGMAVMINYRRGKWAWIEFT